MQFMKEHLTEAQQIGLMPILTSMPLLGLALPQR